MQILIGYIKNGIPAMDYDGPQYVQYMCICIMPTPDETKPWFINWGVLLQ